MFERAAPKDAVQSAPSGRAKPRHHSHPVPGNAKTAQIAQLQSAANTSARVTSGQALQRAADTHAADTRAPDTRATQPDHQTIQRKEVGGGLPAPLKSGVESLSGLSMDHVQVHRNSTAPARVGAHAFAQGSAIHLGPGQDRHLPHEAWHVVQQAQGRVAPTMQMKTMQMKGISINNDSALEIEADIMGARAAEQGARQLAHTTALTQPAINPFHNDAPVQGKFGFEIETRIMATAATEDREDLANARYGAPDTALTNYPVLGTAAGFDLHLDHIGTFKGDVAGGPIIELVTNPAFDEATETENAVAAKMQTMVTTANDLAARPHQPRKLASITGVTAVGAKANQYLFAGAPGVNGQKGAGYVQATIGAKLSAVPQLFEHIATDELQSSSKDADRLKEAVAVSAEMFARCEKALKDHYLANDGTVPAGWAEQTDTSDPSAPTTSYYHQESDQTQSAMPNVHDVISHDLRELSGLLAMIANYLIAGKDNKGGKEESANLLKNLIGQVFYKTSLATVRNNLRGYAKKAVKTPAWRDYLRDTLLKKTGINATAPLTTKNYAGQPAAGAYIDAVLAGTSDWVFDTAKNPYSNEIIDNVGETGRQAPAAVMENRRVKPLPVNPDGDSSELARANARRAAGLDLKQQAPSEWVKLARQYHKIATAINAPVPTKPAKYQG